MLDYISIAYFIKKNKIRGEYYMKEGLRRRDVFAIVLGSIIGWGSFMLPGTKFLKESGIINTAIGLFLGAFFIIIIESSYRVMLENLKDEGGEFTYTYDYLGKNHGFIVGWALSLAYLTMVPFNGTAFALVIKKIFGNVLEFGYLYSIGGYKVFLGEVIASSLVVLLFAYINIKGIKETSKTQNRIVFTLVITVFSVFIVMFLKVDKTNILNNYILDYEFNLGQIAKVLAITPFAFVGFDAIPQLSKEFNFSAKSASIIAIVSLLIASVIYNLLNITTGMVFSPMEAFREDWALGAGVLNNLGSIWFFVLVLGLSGAVTSGINGFMLSTGKLMGAISNKGILPKRFGILNKNGVFQNTIIFTTIISLIAPWFGREVILWIVDMSSLGAAIAYLYVCVISFKKGQTNYRRVMALLGIMVSIAFVGLLLIPGSPAALGIESLIALGVWIILGIVFYVKVLV